MSEPGHYIGAPVHRVEDPRLLTGRGSYVGDVVLPRMAHVAFVRAWPSHARVVSIDASEARAVPGVLSVLTAADLPAATLVDANQIPGLAKTPQPLLARDRVRFVGEAVAIIVAEDRYVAEDAAEFVQVEYEPLPAVIRPTRQPEGHIPLHAESPDNILYDRGESFGEPARVFGEAPNVFAKDLTVGRSMAAPIETRGAVADYDRSRNTLDFWCSTQSPHLLRRRLAASTGIPEHHVRVLMPDVGGGFGQKIAVHPEELAVALASMRVGVPLKWVEDRREHLMAAPHARDQRVHLELAVDDDGRFLAMRAEVLGDAGAYSFNSASALIEPYLTAKTLPGMYRLDHYEYRVVAGVTNKAPVAPYRGVGFVVAQTVRELLIDEVARQVGVDRFELRLRNMIRPQDLPHQACTGLVYDSGSYQAALEATRRSLRYDDFLVEQTRERETGRYIGFGVSPCVEPTGWGSEGMRQIGWHSFPSNDSARVSMDMSGKVTVSVGTPSQGQGIETTLAQVAAETIGVPLDDVIVSFTDSSAAPISLAGTRASRAAVVSGGAVGLAAHDLRERIRKVASMLLEVDGQTLTVRGGQVRSEAVDGISMSVSEVVRRAFELAEIREVEPEPNFTSTRFYDPAATYSNACIGAVVEVDVDTGGVRVRQLVGVEDCGTVINPLIVEGQLAGGIAQGLGGALFERVAYDEDGEVQTTTFMDYLLPTTAEVPSLRVGHLSTPSPHTWHGIKGMGESGGIAAPAAIAAAVADAVAPLGGSVSELPLLPETVVETVGWRDPGDRESA